ncbi:hypothetical protein [Pseudosulfitobacter koreensis]|uniref:Uncharacterized protein n=1 Tax=Pseudosulfitobacter koreensis TaxID=2968472 RepID=A0ABT1Z403_9RHOB|nr:hypothetical protein [Pseudosulfitobacter koreense]MCR8827867.1 hypothetical protein [Pseudosulfitobacter koreense]
MTKILFDRPRRRYMAPFYMSPFWVFITRGGRPSSCPPHLSGLSDHIRRDIGFEPRETRRHFSHYL